MIGGSRAAARTGVPEDDKGRRHVMVITPEGGQCIGVRAFEGAEHTILSREDTRRNGAEREVLARLFEVKGPPGIRVRKEETCIMVFPLGGPHGRRVEIPALVVDTLERYCRFLQDSMWKWQVQLGKADAGILPLL